MAKELRSGGVEKDTEIISHHGWLRYDFPREWAGESPGDTPETDGMRQPSTIFCGRNTDSNRSCTRPRTCSFRRGGRVVRTQRYTCVLRRLLNAEKHGETRDGSQVTERTRL
eukprot:1344657-Amorphochlora_amoeboformis.AAC.2